jgi:DNA gyrase/topoisomerase IV subunit B
MSNLELGNISRLAETYGVSDQLEKLQNDVEHTSAFRDSLCKQLNISLSKQENSNLGNFTLGIVDGIIEFPTIVELYINNPKFRNQLWLTLKQLSIRDFVNSILDIGKDIVYGDAYEK